MFEGKRIVCSAGNNAEFVCTHPQCNNTMFICSKTCTCFKPHKIDCQLKNIRQLTNGIQTLLNRNFRNQWKGEGIQIMARVAKQTRKGPLNFRFCLTQCKADEKRDMEFQVRSLKGCIGFGVLHKPTIIRHLYQYMPDQNYINHGAFMILSNGYSYSHSYPNQNFVQYQGISMNQGDKVQLYIQKKRLVLQQKGCRVILSLPDSLEDLYYGVYLYEQGDEAEVLIKK